MAGKVMKVSVCVPLYNDEKWVARCLSFLARQTHRDLEILVWDDGSTDDSIGAARFIKDGRITIFEGVTNRGQSFARNRLWERATGDLIIFHDADNFSNLNRIEGQARFMRLKSWPIVRTRRRPTSVVTRKIARDWPFKAMHACGSTGSIDTSMMPREPMVPWQEDMRQFEEKVWRLDLALVWGPKMTMKGAFYYYNDDPSCIHISDKRSDFASAEISVDRVLCVKRKGCSVNRMKDIKAAAAPIREAILDGTWFQGK